MDGRGTRGRSRYGSNPTCRRRALDIGTGEARTTPQRDASMPNSDPGTVVVVHYGLGAIIVLLVAILIVLIVR